MKDYRRIFAVWFLLAFTVLSWAGLGGSGVGGTESSGGSGVPQLNKKILFNGTNYTTIQTAWDAAQAYGTAGNPALVFIGAGTSTDFGNLIPPASAGSNQGQYIYLVGQGSGTSAIGTVNRTAAGGVIRTLNLSGLTTGIITLLDTPGLGATLTINTFGQKVVTGNLVNDSGNFSSGGASMSLVINSSGVLTTGNINTTPPNDDDLIGSVTLNGVSITTGTISTLGQGNINNTHNSGSLTIVGSDITVGTVNLTGVGSGTAGALTLTGPNIRKGTVTGALSTTTTLADAAAGANSDITSLTGLPGMTTNFVWTANGAGLAPTFQAAAGGGSVNTNGLNTYAASSTNTYPATSVLTMNGKILFPRCTTNQTSGFIADPTGIIFHTYAKNLAGSEENIWVGTACGNTNVANTAYECAAVGSQVMRNITTGFGNVGIGGYTMISLTTASSCTSVGSDSMDGLSTGPDNTSVGYYSLYSGVGTGARNTAVGSNAGSTMAGAARDNSYYGAYNHKLASGNNVSCGSYGVSNEVLTAATSLTNSWSWGVSCKETDHNTFMIGPTNGSVTALSVVIGASTAGAHFDNQGSTILGTGATAFTSILTATAALDFPNILAAASADLTVTVTGVTTNDSVMVGAPTDENASLITRGIVTSVNTVTVRAYNIGAIAVDQASKTYRVTVIHQ